MPIRCEFARSSRSAGGGLRHARRGGPRLGLFFASLAAGAMLAAGCSSTPPGGSPAASSTPAGVDPAAGSPTRSGAGRAGGFYKDDGPGERQPAELAVLAAQPDPVPFAEPLHPRANRPYRVLGNDYRPMTRREPFLQRGIGSWYGRMFHGQPTSIGERYDMYRMTAAHPTLPIPSFARVTNLENGRQVVVRVNDRGPFLHDRAIDLSYLAAYKLGYVESGSAMVQVELLDPAPQPATSPSGAHYLQLGAFSSRDNAEAASLRLRKDLDWLGAPIRVSSSGATHRVQAGPFPAREPAARAGVLIQERIGLRPMLVSH